MKWVILLLVVLACVLTHAKDDIPKGMADKIKTELGDKLKGLGKNAAEAAERRRMKGDKPPRRPPPGAEGRPDVGRERPERPERPPPRRRTEGERPPPRGERPERPERPPPRRRTEGE